MGDTESSQVPVHRQALPTRLPPSPPPLHTPYSGQCALASAFFWWTHRQISRSKLLHWVVAGAPSRSALARRVSDHSRATCELARTCRPQRGPPPPCREPGWTSDDHPAPSAPQLLLSGERDAVSRESPRVTASCSMTVKQTASLQPLPTVARRWRRPGSSPPPLV